eukprot:4796680-Prymnesium_polylepis.1
MRSPALDDCRWHTAPSVGCREIKQGDPALLLAAVNGAVWTAVIRRGAAGALRDGVPLEDVEHRVEEAVVLAGVGVEGSAVDEVRQPLDAERANQVEVNIVERPDQDNRVRRDIGGGAAVSRQRSGAPEASGLMPHGAKETAGVPESPGDDDIARHPRFVRISPAVRRHERGIAVELLLLGSIAPF